MTLGRRQFLVRAAGAVVGGPALLALVSGRPAAAGIPPTGAGASPYGPLGDAPDANGLVLPAGFTSRAVAAAGEVVGSTSYVWPPLPDGAGVLPMADGGWCYACNSNVVAFGAAGSVSGLRFASNGDVTDAYVVLNGSSANSGGCMTPWGTWLSVEQDVLYDQGLVWECDPTGERLPGRRPALGRFSHSSVAIDPSDGRVYLTQAHPLGLLYRFTPSVAGNLREGLLEACLVAPDGSVSWAPVPDPLGTDVRTRDQVPGARQFAQAGGAWFHDGWLYVASELDHAVHGIDLRNQRYRLVWQGDPGAALSDCDVLAGFVESGDLLVGRTGPARELVLITAAGAVAPLVRLAGPMHEGSRLTGPAFDPSGTRLYVSSQRATTAKALGEILPGLDVADFRAGVTYEITGPFVGAAHGALPPVVETTVPAAVETTVADSTPEPPPSTIEPVPSTVPAATLAPVAPEGTLPAPTVVTTSGTMRGFGMGIGASLLAVGGYALYQRFAAGRDIAVPAATTDDEAVDQAAEEEVEAFVQLELPFDSEPEPDVIDVGDVAGGGEEPAAPEATSEPEPEREVAPLGVPDIGSRNEASNMAQGFDSTSFDIDGGGGLQARGESMAFDLSANDPDRLHTPDEYTEEEVAAMAAAEAAAAEDAAIAAAAERMAATGLGESPRQDEAAADA